MKYFSVFLLLVLGCSAMGLDTTEAFEPGFSNVEFYMGKSGLKHTENSAVGETLFGMGISKNFSVGFSHGISSESNPGLQELTTHIYYNAIQRGAFSFDLLANHQLEGCTLLATESNVDFKHWGLQLCLESEFEPHAHTIITVVPLLYCHLGQHTQLLLAVDWNNAQSSTYTLERGAVCFGVNVVINEIFELISQVDYQLASGFQKADWNASIGFIATL